jgi:uncharacterized damage-inducible protein DinB
MTNSSNQMVADFLHYNRWANLQLIDACLGLTPDQLASTAPGAYGSIYDTFVHLIRAEGSYYRRLSGIRLDPPFSWDPAPSLSEIRPYAEQVSSALLDTAGQMQVTDTIERTWNEPEWDGLPARYKAVSLLIQVLNHGIEHRTNITTILAQRGLQTPDLAGWEFMRLNPDRMGA